MQKKLFYCTRKIAYILDLARFALQKQLQDRYARFKDYDLNGDPENTYLSEPHVFVFRGLASNDKKYEIEITLMPQPHESGLWTVETISISELEADQYRPSEISTRLLQILFFREELLQQFRKKQEVEDYLKRKCRMHRVWKLPAALGNGELRERR